MAHLLTRFVSTRNRKSSIRPSGVDIGNLSIPKAPVTCSCVLAHIARIGFSRAAFRQYLKRVSLPAGEIVHSVLQPGGLDLQLEMRKRRLHDVIVVVVDR